MIGWLLFGMGARIQKPCGLFCSTFECAKLHCIPASIAPDVPMSGAARVNEPFPGPLAAEYYIDNRNYLPSVGEMDGKTVPLRHRPKRGIHLFVSRGTENYRGQLERAM